MRRDVRAKKSLGQHFLTDLSVAERIADSLLAYPLPILEIGPGMGVLTQFLIQKYEEMKVIEIDEESVSYLRTHYPDLTDHIIYDDFLKTDLTKIFGGRPFMIIGNYPYNISTQIFFHILEYKDLIPACSGMFQREVAARIASGPGSKEYGIMSVLLQLWYDIEYLFTVDEWVFSPPPKVKSGVIRLVRNGRKEAGCNERLLKSIVKTLFNRRRKTIRNSLKPLLGEIQLPADAPFMSHRPEQLGVEDFISLTNYLEPLLSSEAQQHS